MVFSDIHNNIDGDVNPLQTVYHDELVSVRLAHPSKASKSKRVYICAHGFGASPYEWQEFKEYAEQHGALVSAVYLGKHHHLRAFRKSSWKDWAKPIVKEYNALIQLGFTDIRLCGSSTGAALLLQLLHHQVFQNDTVIKQCIFIDPLLELRKKSLYLLPFLRFFLADPTVKLSEEESPHWLHKRPKTALLQLLKLIKANKQLLKSRLTIPTHIDVSIFHAAQDPVLDPNGIRELYHQLKKVSAAKIESFRIPSALHVFTRLAGRDNISPKDIGHQRQCFEQLLH